MKLFVFFIFIISNIIGFAQSTTDTIVLVNDKLDVPLRVGLVLSGGGAKGIAHIGVLKVLEEEGIYVDYVGGTSMGGLIGGLYASGYSPAELEELVKNMPWSKLLADEPVRRDLPLDEKIDYDEYLMSLPVVGFVPGLPKGLKRGQLVLNYISKLTWNVADIDNFEDLPIPYFCVATKLENGDTMVIDKGNLPIAMRATMSIPSVFEPIEVNGEFVIDGGLVNNFPVDIMLEKTGVDYVIGVDVGAPLYKAEEITSIVSILDQTSSFHGQERFRSNKRLTDLYIQPDITGLSALSFEDIDSIILRGEVAARAYIAEIRSLSKSMNDNKLKYTTFRSEKRSDTVYISSIDIKGLEKVSSKMVIGRLGLNIPGANSIENINMAIDRLYSSKFFSKIDYKLIKEGESYILEVQIEEKTENLFQLGANYNSETQALLKINLSFHNLLIKGSKMSLSLGLGRNPAGELRYLVDRGEKLGYGTKVGYHSRSIYTYDDNYLKTTSEYFSSFVETSVFGYFNFSNNSALFIGGNIDLFGIKSEVSAIPIDKLSFTYYRGFVKFTNDSYDNKSFPTKGKFFDFEVDYVKPDLQEPLVFYKLHMSTVFKTTKRLAIIPSVFVGGSVNGLTRTGYFYVVGGSNESNYENFVKMPGLPYTSVIDNNFGAVYLDFRYELFPKNYIFLRTSVGANSTYFEELLINSQLLYSGTFGYSIQSPIGPIGIQFGTSNLDQKLGVYFNIGFDL